MEEKMILAVLYNLLEGCNTIEDLKTKVINRFNSIDIFEQEDKLKRKPIGGKHANGS